MTETPALTDALLAEIADKSSELPYQRQMDLLVAAVREARTERDAAFAANVEEADDRVGELQARLLDVERERDAARTETRHEKVERARQVIRLSEVVEKLTAVRGELDAAYEALRALVDAADKIVPDVEDCLRYLSKKEYRTYAKVWDATRTTLTALQRTRAAARALLSTPDPEV